MQSERPFEASDLGIKELILILWRGKITIVVCMVIAALCSVLIYIFLPRQFESRIEISPILSTEFSNYLALSNLKVFNYTPQSLLQEYAGRFRDFDSLVAEAKETGVVPRRDMTDNEYNTELRKFVAGLKIDYTSSKAGTGEWPSLSMIARAGQSNELFDFLTRQSTSTMMLMAEDMAAELLRQAAVVRDQQLSEVENLNVEIQSSKARFDKAREDQIKRLSEQSAVAHSLNIDKPLELKALDMSRPDAGSMQINASTGSEPYLSGYLALDEQIRLLRERTDNDAYVDGLRESEQRMYLLKNDPLSARIVSLVQQSPLNEPATAKLVNFSVASAFPQKVFPRLSIFLPAAFFLGLLAGCGIVVMRANRA